MMKRIIVVQYLAIENNNNQYQQLNRKLAPYLLTCSICKVGCRNLSNYQSNFIHLKQFKVILTQKQ